MEYKVDYRKESSDIVYFSATVTNTSDSPKIIDFNQSRPQNILDKANDYYMTVLRFTVPHTTVAIFNFNQDDYYITIQEGATQKTVQLIYQDQGNPTADSSATFQGIYYIQQFLDIINTALNTAHNNAPASPGNPPQMILNDDGSFSLIVDTQYTNQIISMNQPLYAFFNGLDANFVTFTGNVNYELRYGLRLDNIGTYLAPLVGNYYIMRQESQSQYAWSNIKYIAVTSNSIPCAKEYIGIPFGTKTDESQTITDYIPLQGSYSPYDRSDWYYNAGDAYRLIDLESDGPLRRIDFQFILINKDNFAFPLQLGPGESADLKFMFAKRSLFNNEYNGLVNFEKRFKDNFLGISQADRQRRF